MLYESSQLAQGPLGSTCLSRAHPCPGEAAPPTTVALRSGPVSHTQASSVVAPGGGRASSSLSRVKTLSGGSGAMSPGHLSGASRSSLARSRSETRVDSRLCCQRDANKTRCRQILGQKPCFSQILWLQTDLLSPPVSSLSRLPFVSPCVEGKEERGREGTRSPSVEQHRTLPYRARLCFA